MLSSRQRLCLVGCLCVQFQRQSCSIPELPILLSQEHSLSVRSYTRRVCLSSFLSFRRAPSQTPLPLFQMWRSLSRVLSFLRPWLSCLVPTLMSFWVWIGLPST